MDSYEHIADMIIGIIIIFLIPMQYFGQKQDALIRTMISSETKILVNEIRSKGYLTKDMYDSYLEELSKTDLLYDIAIEHRQLIYEPEYRFRTEEEVKEEQDSAYTGKNYYTYRPVYTEIPAVSDPVSGNLNTDTNESVLASAVNIPASPSHIHTDSCYNGIKHIHSGSPSGGGECYGQSSTVSGICGGTYFHEIQVGNWYCPVCGYNDHYPVGQSPSTPTHYAHGKPCSGIIQYGGIITEYFCNICGQVYLNRPSSCSNYVTRTDFSLSCGKTEGHYYNGNVEVFPICNQLITSIAPTHPVQTVAAGDPLITTVTANYQDGSTKVVVAVTDVSTVSPVKNWKVTLTYHYSAAGVSYTKTCTITVTVIPRSKQCINGHTYNLNADGSDPGCPYCRAWLKSLEVFYPASGVITLYKGTTLQENGVTLLATYLDGRKEYLYSEYVDNLDMQYIGSQNVTISYKGKYVSLTVITKRNLILCPVCNRYYELYPDGTDPGCPYCLSHTPIFTGNIMEYYRNTYTKEIQKELYEGCGTYYFSDRDYIQFHIINVQKSWGGRLMSLFHHNLEDKGIQTVYGGYIRENGYED
jgi:hypothetical protein